MKFTKKSLTQWMTHRCERQLGLSLWTDSEQRADTELGIPHRQILPGLNRMAAEGDDWQALKVADLLTAFGATSVIGQLEAEPQMNGDDDYRSARYTASPLADHLALAEPGDFIVESEFGLDNDAFRAAWSLDWADEVGLVWSDVRPDIIEVLERDDAKLIVDLNGTVTPFDDDDERLVLRVIDAKLSSEPGRGYYAEVAFYALTLAAWLVATGLDDRFAVDAAPALWPGSHTESSLRIAWRDDADRVALIAALNEDLEECPMGVFVPEIRKFFLDTLPRVARTAMSADWVTGLRWHVVQSCSGCDYLGQPLPDRSNGTGAAAPHDNHCIPTAGASDHVSLLPYVPRGGTTVLAELGVRTTSQIAGLQPDDTRLDEHHSLRAGRQIIPTRARTLGGTATPGLAAIGASTASIPSWSDLNLFITADFDPTSAITAAFGLSAVHFVRGQQPTFQRPIVFLTESRSVLHEREQLGAFLTTLDEQLNAAVGVDADATVQLYVWDELTLKHLTRVIGRHLAWLLASGHAARLAWLFPPEDQVLANERIVATPAVSVVADAVRSLIATDQAHAYTLLETARRYHDANLQVERLDTPAFWTTSLSDQIPGERIFELWHGSGRASVPHTQLVERLTWTVRARHSALRTIVQRLRQDLRGQMHREAPKIRHLGSPEIPSATSFLGSLLVCFSKLDFAINLAENMRTRALAPHEREAKFASILCRRRLSGADESAAAQQLGVAQRPGRWFYEILPGSSEARAEADQFLWCLSPTASPELVYRSLAYRIHEEGLANEDWWSDQFTDPDLYPYLGHRPKWAKALSVTIRGIDRQHHLIALDPEYPGLLGHLEDAGLIDLGGECIADPVLADLRSKRIADAAKAVGNPAAAVAHEAPLRQALGVTTRGPRRTNPVLAVHELLWSPAAMHDAVVAPAPPVELRDLVDESLTRDGSPSLNELQWDAWTHAMERRLTLIWGPPGTGKSRTLGGVLDGYAIAATAQPRRCRILITAGTWKAIDNVLVPFLRRNPDVATFRARSSTRPAPGGELDAVDLNLDDPGALDDLANEIDTAEGPIVVACTPQQAQKVIKACLNDAAAGNLFDVIVVDEAGQLDVGLALVALAALAPNGQVVIAGDPLQLPPIVALEPPEHLAWMVGPLYDYFNIGYGIAPHELLTNYRSNKEIVALSRLAGYPAGFTASDPDKRLPLSAPSDLSPAGWPDTIDWEPEFNSIVDPAKPIICLTYPEGVAGQWNLFEADLTRALVCLLVARLDDEAASRPEGWMWSDAVGIVTPHRAQRSQLVRGLTTAFPTIEGSVFNSVVDTVERFQGQERDVILASYAVGDPDTIATEEEFLQNLNRFNVLATRPKSKLIVAATDELIGHLASDIRTLRSSALLKQFASTYCDETATLEVRYNDPRRGPQVVPVTVRWPSPVTAEPTG